MQCIAAGYKDDDPYILYGREGVRKYMRAMYYIYIYMLPTGYPVPSRWISTIL